MRKIMFSAIALMALVAVSCQKEEKLNPAFTAHSENDGAKVSLNSNNYFEWESTDQVAVYDALNSAAVYSVQPRTGDATWAELTWQSGSVIGEGDYTAIYPAAIALTPSSVKLPLEQHSTDGSFTQFPMMATSSSLELQFGNLCAAIKVVVPATGHAIKRISVTADNAVCGQATIATAPDGKPYANVAGTGGRTVTLNIANPQAYTEAHNYYIAMPAGVTYRQMTIRFCDDQGAVATKSFSSEAGMTLQRSKVSTITFGSALDFEQIAPATLRNQAFYNCPAERIVFHYNYFGDVTGATRIDTNPTDPDATPIYQKLNGNTYDIYTPATTIHAMDCSCLFAYDYDHYQSSNCPLMQIDFGDGFNTSDAMSMNLMFYFCGSLTSLDVSFFNTENVTEMSSMFGGCSSLTSLDVSSFNTENVTDMRGTFGSCSSLTSLDLSSFNTENVTDMCGLFENCSSLTSLDVSFFNTENVTEMSSMFSGCSSLTSLDLSSFNTENVTRMVSMFDGCSSLISLDLSSFNTENVTRMFGMFRSCSSLTSLDVSSFNTENVTNMFAMFGWCRSLTSLDLSYFNTENVTTMGQMFCECNSLTGLDLSSFNTENVTNMSYLFCNCSSLTSLDLSSFNTANVTDMSYLFSSCSSLTSLDLSSFSSNALSNFAGAFFGCTSLQSLRFSNGFTLSNSCSVTYALYDVGTDCTTTIKCNSQTKNRLMTAEPGSGVVWDLY